MQENWKHLFSMISTFCVHFTPKLLLIVSVRVSSKTNLLYEDHSISNGQMAIAQKRFIVILQHLGYFSTYSSPTLMHLSHLFWSFLISLAKNSLGRFILHYLLDYLVLLENLFPYKASSSGKQVKSRWSNAWTVHGIRQDLPT